MSTDKTPSRGKGGNLQTSKNPFYSGPKAVRLGPDFTEVSDLGKALQVLTTSGCALIIGRTRDGGAVVFTVLDGDNRHRTYCSDEHELQDAVDAIVNLFTEQ